MTRLSLAAISLAFILAACGGSSRARGGADAAGTVKAKPGSRIVLNGRSHGKKVKMAVTLTKVVPFARSEWNPMGGRLQPPDGRRHFAVQFRLTNIGDAPAVIWPSNAAQVVDSKGRSYDFYVNNGVPSCRTFMHPFMDKETIAPRNSALGCVAREIPKHVAITAVRFTLHSGDTGQWDVG